MRAQITTIQHEYGLMTIYHWPAVTYIEVGSTMPVQLEPGNTICVGWHTARYGIMHKEFGTGLDKGEPYSFGLAVSITSEDRAHRHELAVPEGQQVKFRGLPGIYTVEKTHNQNIMFVPYPK